MKRTHPYNTGLDKNPANFVALSPLSYLQRTARVRVTAEFLAQALGAEPA